MAVDWWLRMHAEDLAARGNFKVAFETLRDDLVPQLEERVKPRGLRDDPLLERIRELKKDNDELKASAEFLLDQLDAVRNERDDIKERLDAVKAAVAPALELVDS